MSEILKPAGAPLLDTGIDALDGLEITQQKRNQEALQRAERKYRALVEQIPAIVYTAQLDDIGTTTFISPQVETILGFTPAEWIAEPSLRLERIHPDDREQVAAAVKDLRDKGRFTIEFRILARDGRIVWLQDSASILRDDAGQPLLAQGVAIDITDPKQAKEKLREYAERSQVLSRRLVEIQEIERRHLARELHDEIGQILTAILYNLQASKSGGTAGGLPRLEETIAIVDCAIQLVRQLSLELRPPMLDDLGLAATLRWYAESLAERTGLTIHLITPPSGTDLLAEVKNATFRIAQEALTNIVRHAQAHQAWVALHGNERGLHLVILDDGVGFDVSVAQQRAAKGKSFGILGMQERVEMLGGRFAMISRHGQGTVIEVHVPLTAAEQSEEMAIRTDSQNGNKEEGVNDETDSASAGG